MRFKVGDRLNGFLQDKHIIGEIIPIDKIRQWNDTDIFYSIKLTDGSIRLLHIEEIDKDFIQKGEVLTLMIE